MPCFRSTNGFDLSQRREVEGVMPIKTRSANTSLSSPGQSGRRDELIRIYDELDDAGKRELLRFAIELLRAH
jgi:hypothetical protein